MPQSAQEQNYYDTAVGALMKHDIPFVAIKGAAVVECHMNILIFRLVDFYENHTRDPYGKIAQPAATTLALLPTNKDQHNHEKTYKKNRNFNALQATLYNVKIYWYMLK